MTLDELERLSKIIEERDETIKTLKYQLKTAHRAISDLINEDIGNNYAGKIYALENKIQELEKLLGKLK